MLRTFSRNLVKIRLQEKSTSLAHFSKTLHSLCLILFWKVVLKSNRKFKVAIWSQSDKKNVIFSELQKTGTNVILNNLMNQGTFNENMKWSMPKRLKIWGFEVHQTGSHIDLLLWWCAFVDGNHAVLGANRFGSGPRDAYQHHNIVPQTMFHVIKELYIQVTNPSTLIISSAVQNQSERYNDVVYMWQLCPKTHSVVLNLWRRQLLLPPHDAMYWLLLSSTSCRRWT